MNRSFNNWRNKGFSDVDEEEPDAYVNSSNVKAYIKENPSHITNMGFVKNFIPQLKELGYKFVDDTGRLEVDSLKKVIEANPSVVIFEKFMGNYAKEMKELGFLEASHNGELYMSEGELKKFLQKYPQIKNNEYYRLHYGEGAIAAREARGKIERQMN